VLRCAALPRFLGQNPPARIPPKTNILGSRTDNKGHYNIKEQEIPATVLTVRKCGEEGVGPTET